MDFQTYPEDFERDADARTAVLRRRRDARVCQHCGGVVFKLHSGSMYLYVRDGKVKALADMKHVYYECSEGLKENIVFLYRMLNSLRSRRFNAVIVGKAYGGDLYAYVRESVEREKNRL